ncbi:nuclear transport factor 2 family protein [Chryseobacterium sp. WG23]|uniref:nuclear transport factor 2 family protein n=1 Tax=Chryseobacterium sp. WG23 TaxID=2926910 RepID=UPI00211EA114|nr:nuclear transport factor 2 family protein [Chryseobacterium sp. WG23]MCQ9636099.1 nuclear transport factor 2 family protein [Chryseobacterium sp. WG23]
MENELNYIYEKWHLYAKNRQPQDLIDLYAEDAVFESPLVPRILDTKSGILKGKNEILRFLEEGTKRRPNELVRWYRNGDSYTAKETLIWEYPRETPDGDQIDILELMKIKDGKITNHRIYWGWFGTETLIKSALKKNE